MKRPLLILALVLALGTCFELPAEAKEQPKVELFVTSWCPYCRRLETFLKQSGIDYTRHDIEADAKSMAVYDSLGATGIPVARVGKDVIYGYDPEGIIASLKKAGG